MKFRNTFIALALLILVGGYALYLALVQHAGSRKKLVPFKAKDITGIELKYSTQDIELTRGKGGKWRLVKPLAARADQAAANGVAQAVADCEIKRVVEKKPADLAPFGLKPPKVELTITSRTHGKLAPILVGKETPVGFSAYVKLADKAPVLMVSSAFPGQVTKKLNDLRDRTLMNFKVSDVTKFTIQRQDQSPIEVDRKDGHWQIVKPAQYKADITATHMLLSSLADLRVAGFVSDKPENLATYGLDHPRLILTVFLKKKGESASLEVGAGQGKDKEGIYVARGGSSSVFTVYKGAYSDVDKSLLDLRDKQIASFDPGQIAKVKVHTITEDYTLERTPANKWLVVLEGRTSPADVRAVRRFIDQVAGLKGVTIAADPMTDPKQYGMSDPHESIALFGKDGKQIAVVKLTQAMVSESHGPASAGSPGQNVTRGFFYANASSGTAVYTISEFDYNRMNKTAYDFGLKMAQSPTPKASPAAAKPPVPAAAALGAPSKR